MFNVAGVHNMGIDHFTIECFVDCMLHTVDLGVLLKFHGKVLVEVLRRDCFATGGATILSKVEMGLTVIKSRLKSYYKEQRHAYPTKPLSTIKKISLGMLGKFKNPNLKVKGGESRDLLPFTTALAAEFQGQLGPLGPLLAAGGRSMIDFIDLTRQRHRQLPVEVTGRRGKGKEERRVEGKGVGEGQVPREGGKRADEGRGAGEGGEGKVFFCPRSAHS